VTESIACGVAGIALAFDASRNSVQAERSRAVGMLSLVRSKRNMPRISVVAPTDGRLGVRRASRTLAIPRFRIPVRGRRMAFQRSHASSGTIALLLGPFTPHRLTSFTPSRHNVEVSSTLDGGPQ
jgi:hypothetical protein